MINDKWVGFVYPLIIYPFWVKKMDMYFYLFNKLKMKENFHILKILKIIFKGQIKCQK